MTAEFHAKAGDRDFGAEVKPNEAGLVVSPPAFLEKITIGAAV